MSKTSEQNQDAMRSIFIVAATPKEGADVGKETKLDVMNEFVRSHDLEIVNEKVAAPNAHDPQKTGAKSYEIQVPAEQYDDLVEEARGLELSPQSIG